jgi:hypothetical protein
VFGGQDIQTGFSEFDSKFILRSGDPDKALRIFGMKVCDSLLDNYKDIEDQICLYDDKIEYQERGYMTSDSKRERFVKMLDVCVDVAEAVK